MTPRAYLDSLTTDEICRAYGLKPIYNKEGDRDAAAALRSAAFVNKGLELRDLSGAFLGRYRSRRGLVKFNSSRPSRADRLLAAETLLTEGSAAPPVAAPPPPLPPLMPVQQLPLLEPTVQIERALWAIRHELARIHTAITARQSAYPQVEVSAAEGLTEEPTV